MNTTKILAVISLFLSYMASSHSARAAEALYGQSTLILITPAAVGTDTTAIEPRGSNVARLVWNADTNTVGIIEKKGPLGYDRVWETESFITDSSNSIVKRTIATRDDFAFFRTMKASTFGTRRPVTWGVNVPTVLPSDFEASTATWIWEDSGETNIVPANTLMTRDYHTPGMKGVEIIITGADGSTARKRWAVNITNSFNLIYNPDLTEMSNGLPVGWNMGGYGNNNRSYVFPVPGPSGTNDRAVRVNITAFNEGDTKYFADDVLIDYPGHIYRYSGSYLANVPTELVARYRTSDHGNYIYSYLGSAPTAPSWSTVSFSFLVPTNALSMTVFHSLISTGTLTIDDASLWPVDPPAVIKPLQEGMVTFSFDDCWLNQTNAAAMLEGAGYPGTFYIISGDMEGPGRMSWDDARSLEERGHEIGGHTETHSDLTTLSQLSQEVETVIPLDLFRRFGLQNVRTFAYPYGSFNTAVIKTVVEAGYTGARGVNTGYNAKGQSDLYALKGQNVLRSSTVSEMKGWIDTALANKTWVILILHQVDNTSSPYGTSPARLQAVIDHCTTRNARVVTLAEGLRQMRQ